MNQVSLVSKLIGNDPIKYLLKYMYDLSAICYLAKYSYLSHTRMFLGYLHVTILIIQSWCALQSSTKFCMWPDFKC